MHFAFPEGFAQRIAKNIAASVQTLLVLTAMALTAMLLTVVTFGCSNAETPDAYYVAGPSVDGGTTLIGTQDQPCTESKRCNENLTCVNQNDVLTCRGFCDGTDENDPCGERSTCRKLSGDSDVYVCLPASGLDGTCPCDEGFVCTDITDVGNRCKYECFFDANNVPTDCPEGSCRHFTGSDVNGACIE